MKDRERFAKLMLALSLSLKMYGRELTGPMQEAYWVALSDLSDAEFEQAATVLLRRETEFPPPALFREIAKPKPDIAAEAFRVMEQAMDLTDYHPERGTYWRGQRIREELSEAAYQAFHACGGSNGFRDAESPYHGPRIRREFCEAYQRVTEADPTTLLPAPKAKALPARMLELVKDTSRHMTLPEPR